MRHFLFAIVILLIISSCSGKDQLCAEAYPFGVIIGGTVEQYQDSLASRAYLQGWEQSGIYRLRCEKRDAVRDSLLDRTPDFGTMILDQCMDEPLKFVAPMSLNLPIPTDVDTFCSAGSDDGRITSLNCIHIFVDFEDVSSAVRSYVNMLNAKYGKYKPLRKIRAGSGQDFSSIELFDEGSFIWKDNNLKIELFVGKHYLLRDESNSDLEPLDRYEVVLRYSI